MRIDVTAPVIPDDNACGLVLEMTNGGQTAIWVCTRDRHGDAWHESAAQGSTRWRSRDPRVPGE